MSYDYAHIHASCDDNGNQCVWLSIWNYRLKSIESPDAIFILLESRDQSGLFLCKVGLARINQMKTLLDSVNDLFTEDERYLRTAKDNKF